MARKPRYQRSKVSHLYLDTKHNVYYARGRDAHGTDTWRSLSTKSFEIARARLAEKLAEIQNGKAPRPTNVAARRSSEWWQSFGPAGCDRANFVESTG